MLISQPCIVNSNLYEEVVSNVFNYNYLCDMSFSFFCSTEAWCLKPKALSNFALLASRHFKIEKTLAAQLSRRRPDISSKLLQVTRKMVSPVLPLYSKPRIFHYSLKHIFEAGPLLNPSSRPISITSVSCKLMKHIICTQILLCPLTNTVLEKITHALCNYSNSLLIFMPTLTTVTKTSTS